MDGYERYRSVVYRLHDAARRLGATIEPTPRALRLVKNGVRTRVEFRDDFQYGQRLEMRANALPPGLPRFHVYPEGLKSFASKVFGGQDIELGVSAFDIQYMIKGDDPELVRQVLTADRCMRMVAHFHDSELTCNGDEVVLARPARYDFDVADIVTDADLDAGLTLLFELGSADVFGKAVLRDLPDATYHDDALPYVDIAGPGEIRIGFARAKRRWLGRRPLVTEARAVVPGLADLPPRVVDHVHTVGATIARGDRDVVTVTWPRHILNAQPLVEVIELLRSLVTGPSEGVFR